MNYFIKRDLNEYGPYTLADLQKYVASGNVLMTDLCRSEGLTDWVPVSQVIGNIPVPAAAPAPQPAAGTVYGGTPAAYAVPQEQYPAPPALHWGLVLLLTLVTCFIFGWVWLFIQAAWVKKVQKTSTPIILFAVSLGIGLLAIVVAFSVGMQAGISGRAEVLGYIGLIRVVQLVGHAIMIWGCFVMKNAIEEHYNSAEPIGLTLSGAITFIMSFFNLGPVYFQYHFTRINEMKQRQRMGYPA